MQHAARFYKVKNYSDRELQREKLKQADFIQPMRGSRIFSQGKGGGGGKEYQCLPRRPTFGTPFFF